ncbi:hypothetical protein BJ508DRAFT_334391 [Ascobolus immersus RN42]|uniref:Uncharacterized protein n=1 Tax=Ascobolus immersus RN42 TaxID=1160509 RepID=A0A3N4HG90_ASCIM|nr:hypothetical protein BJ508DRAFT_334391 [Ascobolus immersus RN42]
MPYSPKVIARRRFEWPPYGHAHGTTFTVFDIRLWKVEPSKDNQAELDCTFVVAKTATQISVSFNPETWDPELRVTEKEVSRISSSLQKDSNSNRFERFAFVEEEFNIIRQVPKPSIFSSGYRKWDDTKTFIEIGAIFDAIDEGGTYVRKTRLWRIPVTRASLKKTQIIKVGKGPAWCWDIGYQDIRTEKEPLKKAILTALIGSPYNKEPMHAVKVHPIKLSILSTFDLGRWEIPYRHFEGSDHAAVMKFKLHLTALTGVARECSHFAFDVTQNGLSVMTQRQALERSMLYFDVARVQRSQKDISEREGRVGELEGEDIARADRVYHYWQSQGKVVAVLKIKSHCLNGCKEVKVTPSGDNPVFRKEEFTTREGIEVALGTIFEMMQMKAGCRIDLVLGSTNPAPPEVPTKFPGSPRTI